MTKETSIRLFEQKQVRSVWDSEKEAWYFSIIDVIEVLTGTDRSRKYWSDLKSKLKNEGSELSDKIGQLKMAAGDGKLRLTDVADTEQLFRYQRMVMYLSTKLQNDVKNLYMQVYGMDWIRYDYVLG